MDVAELQVRQVGVNFPDRVRERCVEEEHLGICVLEERAQLVGGVAIVDVEGRCALFECGELGFGILGSVV